MTKQRREVASGRFSWWVRRLIELRSEVKAKLRTANDARKIELDSEQLALKILANATSYGIFVETIVHELSGPEVRTCYGAEDERFTVRVGST